MDISDFRENEIYITPHTFSEGNAEFLFRDAVTLTDERFQEWLSTPYASGKYAIFTPSIPFDAPFQFFDITMAAMEMRDFRRMKDALIHANLSRVTPAPSPERDSSPSATS